MKTILTTLLVLLTVSAFAADPELRGTFPDDYRPHSCAPASGCVPADPSKLIEAGAAYRGYSLDAKWLAKHWDELNEAMAPFCAKIATCFATADNRDTFCTDIIQDDVFAVCERYGLRSEDGAQCNQFVRTFLMSSDQNDKALARAAHACAVEKAGPSAGPRRLDVWMAPAKIDAGYSGKLRVYALDRETRVPVQAGVFIGGRQLFAKGPPSGKAETFYLIPWARALLRTPNAEGHRDVVPPMVRVEIAGYEPVEFPMPLEVPKLIVEMDPPLESLRRGKNTVTFRARDGGTGQPVEARVMAGDRVLGATNKPLELVLERGVKRPEIWVTSLYDRYSDVIVTPGE
jgi:hypothetical protein